MLRVREFEMAEIEHFVHPDKKNKFDKFSNVSDIRVPFFSACDQMDGKSPAVITIGEAVSRVGHVTVMCSFNHHVTVM